MSKNRNALITFKQMFEYERLYNIKVIDKTFHIRRWKYLQQDALCSKSEGGPNRPQPRQKCSIS